MTSDPKSDLESGEFERFLTLEIVRITEAAAIAAARFRGLGDEMAADMAAVEAMHEELNRQPVRGRLVIGEGEKLEADKLFIGENVGTGEGPEVDLAVTPIEGTTACAKALSNVLTVTALAERGNLMRMPRVYMDKIAIGPGYRKDIVSLDATVHDNLHALAKAKNVRIEEITACILDRPRHAKLIGEVRRAGAAIRLIGHGDIAGVIQTTDPMETGIDVYLGTGGAPEGVLAAAALRCTGGQFQARLLPRDRLERNRLHKAGIDDIDRIYTHKDMVQGNVLFAATGITNGYMLEGVRFGPETVATESVVMRSATGTIRTIHSVHKTPEIL